MADTLGASPKVQLQGGATGHYLGKDWSNDKHRVFVGHYYGTNDQRGTVYLLDDEGFARGDHRPCEFDFIANLAT